MSRIPLVFAGGAYPDRTVPLIKGTVQPEGLELNWLVVYPSELFRRMLQFAEFEAAEMSIAFYGALVSRGDDRFVGIPVFPARHFRHGYIFVRSDAGIERPQDLLGRRVGVPEYPMTAAVWIRALLLHDYGVRASEMEWFQGGFETPGFASRFPLDLPPEVHITTIPGDKSLVGMLLGGELDALVGPGRPQAFAVGDERICRLFPNYREMDKDF